MSQPRSILIVTPTLNSEKYLEETILSVASQRGDFVIHYHVQDGVSSDGTLEILRKWEGVFSEGPGFAGGARVFFSWSSETDISMYDSLNKGFSRLLSEVPDAEAALMTWINSDDRLAYGSVQTALSAHRETGYEVITGLASIIMESGVKACTMPANPLARENLRKGFHDGRKLRFVMQEGTYWTPALWQKSGGLNASLRLAGDWDLWRRFAEHAEWLGLKTELAYHRRHALQLSHDHENYWAEVDRVRVSAGIEDDMPDDTALGNVAHMDTRTNLWDVRKLKAGTYFPKHAKVAWDVRFSSLGYPVEHVIGLSHTEHWGRWSDANLYDRVILTLSLELPAFFELSFMAAGYCGNGTFQDVVVVVGDTQKVVRVENTPDLHTLVFENVRPSRFITFIPKNPISPSDLRPGGDTRKLGIGFRTLGFRNLQPSP